MIINFKFYICWRNSVLVKKRFLKTFGYLFLKFISLIFESNGRFSCKCNKGYRGDGVECQDIDECQKGSASCDENKKCQNTPGSYDCVCKDGFLTKNNGECKDIDECDENPCDDFSS